MRKNEKLAAYFQPHYRNYDHSLVERPVSVEVSKEKNPIEEMLFALDEKSRLPRSDMYIYLSDKTSPEVRAYIQQNLLIPHDGGVAIEAEHDSELFDFMPQNGESREDYFARVQSLIRHDEELINASKTE